MDIPERVRSAQTGRASTFDGDGTIAERCTGGYGSARDYLGIFDH